VGILDAIYSTKYDQLKKNKGCMTKSTFHLAQLYLFYAYRCLSQQIRNRYLQTTKQFMQIEDVEGISVIVRGL
jgi:hypothetical protein